MERLNRLYESVVLKEGTSTNFHGLMRDIVAAQDRLLKKVRQKGGVWENFGQDEVRKLKDKYDYSQPEISGAIDKFDRWCKNYTGNL